MRIRREATHIFGGLRLALMLTATPTFAAEVSGPEPGLAPGQDTRAAGSSVRSTVHREADGTAYVLRGPNEKQFLSAFNVTWVDNDNVIGPPGFGGFD